jgi:hypothetical protein
MLRKASFGHPPKIERRAKGPPKISLPLSFFKEKRIQAGKKKKKENPIHSLRLAAPAAFFPAAFFPHARRRGRESFPHAAASSSHGADSSHAARSPRRVLPKPPLLRAFPTPRAPSTPSRAPPGSRLLPTRRGFLLPRHRSSAPSPRRSAHWTGRRGRLLHTALYPVRPKLPLGDSTPSQLSPADPPRRRIGRRSSPGHHWNPPQFPARNTLLLLLHAYEQQRSGGEGSDTRSGEKVVTEDPRWW